MSAPAEHDPLVEAPPPLADDTGLRTIPGRMLENLKTGNLGSGPVIFALDPDRASSSR